MFQSLTYNNKGAGAAITQRPRASDSEAQFLVSYRTLAPSAGAAKFFAGYALSGVGKHAIAANCTHQAVMASLVVDAAYVHHG